MRIKNVLLSSIVIVYLFNVSISFCDDSLDDFPVPLGAEWAQLYPEAYGRSIVAASSGYVIAGRQNGPDSSPLLDYWSILVSYNISGVYTGSKTFDTDSDHNEAFEIIASYDETEILDGYIIAGAKHQAFSEDGHDYYNPYMWLMKTGTDLERIWEYTFGDPFSDYGYSVFNDGTGFIITGEYTNPNESAYLVRTDESGNMTWEASWGTATRWEFMPVTYDSTPGIDGGLVAATDSGLSKLGDYTTTARPSDTEEWSASLTDVLKSVITVSDGYVATGHVEITGDTDYTDLVLLKVNTNGSVAWRHTYGRATPTMGATGMDDFGNEVIQTADGGFAVIGTTNSYAWHGGSDMWLIKTDSSGVMEWDIVAGDTNTDSGRGIVQDAANDLVACGTAYWDQGLGGGLTNWIYTVKFSNSYTPPAPSFTYTPSSPFFIDESIQFDGTGSTPGSAGDGILLYEWDFGDGNYGSGNVDEHTYTMPGTYTVTLYITDSNGIRRETSQTVTANGLATQWEKNPLTDEPYHYNDIVKGDGSNFLIPGYYKQSYSNLNGAATKYSSTGEIIWRRIHADNLYAQSDAFTYGTLGHDGNYVLIGYRETDDVNKRDIRIVKLDATTGDLIWNKIYDYGIGNDDAFEIKPVSSGGYIVIGYAYTKLVEGDESAEASAWLIKIDENGDEEWSQLYNDPGEYFLRGMCVTPTDDGGYLLVANKYGMINDIPMIVIKTDGDGVEQWRHTVPDVDNSKKTGGIWVRQNTQGDYVIAGQLDNEYAIFTIDASGDSHTEVTWGPGHNYDTIYDADLMPDGGYILLGTQYVDNENYGDVYYVRTDSQGNIAWEKTMGGPGTGSEYGKSVATFSDGSIVILYYDEDSEPLEDRGPHLFKIGMNLVPTGDFTFDPASPVTGQIVTFTADIDDADGAITHMTWEFGDSGDDPVLTGEHTYTSTGTYTVTLNAYDNSGAVLEVTHDVTVGEAPDPFWELISLNTHPENTAIGTVIASILDSVISVWSYDDGHWYVYDPENSGFSDLEAMEPGLGYWMHVNYAAELSVAGTSATEAIELTTGWNLVGFNSDVSLATETAIASIISNTISVWAYKENHWYVYDPGNPGFSDLLTMEPGYGYWINAREACTWEQ